MMRPLEDIERDAKAATEGPWTMGLHEEHYHAPEVASDAVYVYYWYSIDGPGGIEVMADMRGAEEQEPDFHFIANARKDIPDLIARVRELEEELSEANDAIAAGVRNLSAALTGQHLIVPPEVHKAVMSALAQWMSDPIRAGREARKAGYLGPLAGGE